MTRSRLLRGAAAGAAAVAILSGCAGPPDASRCADRLDVTITVPPPLDRAESSVLLVRLGDRADALVYRFSGGEPAPIPGISVASAGDLDLSPDGAELALSAGPDAEIFVVDLDSGTLDPLGVSGIDPAWSPDGERIAFSTPSGELYVVDRSGASRRIVPVPDPGPVFAPSWSPDGTRLVVAADTDAATLGFDELHVVEVAGGRSVRIGRGVSTAGPGWAPDGTRIAYHDFDGVHLMCADGGLDARLADDGLYPVWSPDGAEIVFTSTSSRWGAPGLFVIDDAGGTPVRITEGDDVPVDWSRESLP